MVYLIGSLGDLCALKIIQSMAGICSQAHGCRLDDSMQLVGKNANGRFRFQCNRQKETPRRKIGELCRRFITIASWYTDVPQLLAR